MLGDRRAVVALVAVLVLLGTGITAWALRDDPSTSDAAASPATTPPPGTGSHDHEDDHIDEVDPDIDPAAYVPFCDAFYVFANAYSNTVADGTTGESVMLESAAEAFRGVAADTEMTDEVRAGFEWFVDDALRNENEATTEEQGAFSTFLNSACPA